MAKEKKHNVDDIEKLRKILDNPSDPNAAKLLSPNDTSIDSVRRRLTQKPPVSRKIQSVAPSRASSSLQPKVTVRPRAKPVSNAPVSVSTPAAPLPEFEPIPPSQGQASTTTGPLPEFKPVSSQEGTETPTLPEEPSFDDEDLLEIEKVETTYPEFSAVGTTEETGTQESITTPSETLADEDHHRWKPVTETTARDSTFTDEATAMEEIPEFTPSGSQPLREETPEKPVAWTPAAESEAPQGPPQQGRAQKKAEQQRQKEAKRQRKIEQKKERREAKQREKEAKRQRKMEEQKPRMEAHQEEPDAPLFTPAQAEIPPASVEPSEEPVEQPQPIKVDISAFKDIESIDDHIGELLFRNGYFSPDDLRKATIDDLVHIRGMKRKLAKKIKKEVELKTPSKPDDEFVILHKKQSTKKPRGKPEDVTEWESFPVNNHEDEFTPPAATYGEYTLYKKERGRGADKTTIHFFSKEKPATGTPALLPLGYQIAVNKKTKAPYLKKKK
jgi:hypothetical protein